MRLHRLDADAQLVGDDLVHLAFDHPLQYLAFAGGQRGQPRLALVGFLHALRLVGRRCQRAVHRRQQRFLVERFFQKVVRTAFHRLHCHRYVAVAGNEDHRPGVAARLQLFVQLQPAHARHADVQDQAAAAGRGLVAGEETFGAVVTGYLVVVAFQQPQQGVAKGLVVVDQVDANVLGCSHGSNTGNVKRKMVPPNG